ncbi:MAG TPA: M50 family metallopeptidase [Candidatus Dormibacteraeota bacterium]|nr:M50 family metallopeptidase [Candidatus Dormibacteraeota bacterium]
MSALLLVSGLLLFIGLVVAHEFGHFIVARHSGVEVEEFGIFFPPRLFKHKTKSGWLFSLNVLPLGGFVKLKGEHDTDTEEGSFGAASLSAKSAIMAAGVVANLVVALLMLTILAWIGMPKLLPNQFTIAGDTRVVQSSIIVNDIEPGSPADKAGIKPEDKLLAIGPKNRLQSVNNANSLPNVTKQYAGQTVEVEFMHQGKLHQAEVSLRSLSEVQQSLNTNQPKGYLGLVPSEFVLQRSTWSAPIVALGLSAQVTALTFQGLGHALGGFGSLIAGAVTGNRAARQHGQAMASSQVTGPVGIFVVLKDGSLLGYEFMLFIIAIISLTLAIMNILPIPALDGGRLWITLVARSLKKPLSAGTEELVNAVGFIVLIALVILISIVDVKRFF